jgi:orotidine-5'-phosphate decarboxylase
VSSSAARIPAEERLILALDVPGFREAQDLVERLGDSVRFYKIGLELATTPDYFRLLDWLLDRDKRVFCDLKLYDIPATVAAAVRQMSHSGASFLTVHGEPSVMQAAAENKGDTLKVLAVTVLTSMNREDLLALGLTMDVDALALLRAQQAKESGCDGVIASGQEAGRLRERLGRGPKAAAVVTTRSVSRRPRHRFAPVPTTSSSAGPFAQRPTRMQQPACSRPKSRASSASSAALARVLQFATQYLADVRLW